MSVAVSASRFAVLPDDDAADWKGAKKQLNKKKESTKKPAENKVKDANKAKALKEAKELQNIAFGGQKKKKKKGGNQQNQQQGPASSPSPIKEPSIPKDSEVNTNGAAPETVPTEQQVEWQEKDKVSTELQFSKAMQEAILLSKLEAEKAASLVVEQQRLLAVAQPGGQQRGKQTMSLDQFIQEQEKPEPAAGQQPLIYKHPRHKDRLKETQDPTQDFFTQSDKAVAKAIDKEQRLELVKADCEEGGGALVAQYRQLLVAKELELEAERRESEELRDKLADCKLRTKKLTEILMSGEMKEKTEVLVEVNRLEKVRDELTASLSLTAGHLEAERSLVTSLEAELRRSSQAPASATPSPHQGAARDLANRLLALITKARKH